MDNCFLKYGNFRIYTNLTKLPVAVVRLPFPFLILINIFGAVIQRHIPSLRYTRSLGTLFTWMEEMDIDGPYIVSL